MEKIINSTELKKRNDGTEYYAIAENCDEKLKNIYLSMIYDDNIGGTNDLSYRLIYDATAFFSNEITGDETKEEMLEALENYQDFAPIWNSERLEMLNVNNEQDIADIMKEYEIENVSTACAVWYENTIKSIVNTIIDEYVKA